MRWLRIGVAILVILIGFCGCGNETLFYIKENEDKVFPPENVIIYSYEQLEQIVALDYSKEALQSQYPTTFEYQKGLEYQALYFSDEAVAVIRFYEGEYRSGKIYGSKNSKDEFACLSVGTSFSEVRALDPDGDYWFLYTGRGDLKKVSYHYTNDWHVVAIAYNETTGCVSEVSIIPAWQTQ